MQYTGLQYNDTSTTLAGILQDIYFLSKTNSSTFPAGDVNRIVNKYYAQCQNVVKQVNENFYMIVATADLQIGDGSYTYPDGSNAPAYEKLKSIWAAYQPANINSPQVNEFQRVNIVDPNMISDPSYDFTTPTALPFGDYFVLYPLVTDATKYPVKGGVKIYYIPTLDKLVNDADVPKLFPSFHKVITQGALIDIFDRLGNTTKKQSAQKDFDKGLEDIATYASAHLPDEIGLPEGQNTLGGWNYPYGVNETSM